MNALALVLCLAVQNVEAPAEFKGVRDHLQEALRSGAGPSVAVAVVREGRVVWAEGFGSADLEKQSPATADSIYLLASVSKPVTATGLMVLRDRGSVDLDQPANRYLGEAKLRAPAGSADGMTVRRLANHTAGMPLHWNFFYEGTSPPPRDETIRRYGFAAWAPGGEWGYSNLAFGVLDYVTERVSKTPWRAFLEKEVFDPLKMARTSDRVRPGMEKDATAQYDRDREGRFARVAPYGFDHPGASAVWSSANDLARFMLMHLGDGALEGARVLSEDSARAMRVQTSRRADGGGTGVGWAVGPFLGRPSFSHSGGMPGVTTIVVGFPEEKHAVVVLANAGGVGLVQEAARRAMAVLYAGAPAPAAPGPRAPGSAEPAGSVAGKWSGKVAHPDGDLPLALEVAEKGATARWKDKAVTLRQVSVRPGRFGGEFDGEIPIRPDFAGTPVLRLQLRREGERLQGVLMAQTAGRFCLSHWVELDRVRD